MRTPGTFVGLAMLLGLIGVVSVPAHPDEKATATRVARLIEQLGSNSFDEREQATRDLEALGSAALEALRKATSSGDAEVKTRAASLIARAEEKAAQAERRARSARILAATKVRLNFKDTPVAEAIADLSKQSGYPLALQDPEKKLASRKVTLETGEISFWEAYDRLCAAANLVEKRAENAMPLPVPVAPRRPAQVPPPPPGAPPAPAPIPQPPVNGVIEVAAAQIVGGGGQVQLQFGGAAVGGPLPGNTPSPPPVSLTDGKPEAQPTAYAGALRIRVLKEAETAEGEVVLTLEVRAEPKLQMQTVEGVKVEKARDDQGQSLGQLTDVPAAPNPLPAAGGALRLAPGLPLPPRAANILPATGFSVIVRLKKGEKASHLLKELAGALTIRAATPPEPIITANKVLASKGETFKGPDGGYFKVVDLTHDEEKLTLRLEMENPPGILPSGAFGGVIPAQRLVVPRALPLAPARPAQPPAGQKGVGFQAPAPPAQAPAPPPAQVQIQVQAGGAGGGVVMLNGAGVSNRGLTLTDEKGEVILGATRTTRGRFAGGVMTLEYTLEYPLKKGQQPARLAYIGSRVHTLEVPFTLKDVPLP